MRQVSGRLASMLLLLGAGAAFCCLVSGRVLAEEPAGVDQFGVASSTLPNGIKVIVCPRRAVAIAAVDVWVDAGTRRQRSGQEAVAHYLEHVLFTGTPTRPAETDIDGAIEDFGGALNAATSYDWAHFYTVVPASSLNGVLGVMSDVLQHPTLSQASIDEERPIIESEIRGDIDDPASYAAQVTRAAVFGGGSAYGQMITGTVAQADAVQRSGIVEFYHANYQPSRVTVVVSGDVAPDQAQGAIAKAFGGWKAAEASGGGTVKPAAADAAAADTGIGSGYADAAGVVSRTINRPSPNSFLVFGWSAPAVSQQPETWEMDVLLTYLGQGGRNLLDDDLRIKRHLVDAVTADYLTQHDPGILTVTLSLPTANSSDAQERVLDAVRSVRDTPLTDAQLAGAKQQLIASYLFQTETVSGKADSLGFYATINSVHYDENYISHIQSVTAEQVQGAARKYLSPTHYVLTTLAPPNNPQDAGLAVPARMLGGGGLGSGDAAARAGEVER